MLRAPQVATATATAAAEPAGFYKHNKHALKPQSTYRTKKAAATFPRPQQLITAGRTWRGGGGGGRALGLRPKPKKTIKQNI